MGGEEGVELGEDQPCVTVDGAADREERDASVVDP